MKNFFKKFNKHIVIILFIVASAGLTVHHYRASLIRCVQGVKDFGLSVAYYFCSFFDVDVEVTVNTVPDLDILYYLPYDFENILRRLKEMWGMVFNLECFSDYIQGIADGIYNFCLYFMLLAPVVLMLGYVVVKCLLSPNEREHGHKSRVLRRFENKDLPRLIRVKNWFSELFGLLVKNRFFFWSVLLLWLLNFNILTIGFEFLAYYFYFAMAFDFLSLFVQLGKLILDVFIMFSGAPLVFWCLIAYCIIVFVRKRIGYKRLWVREISNRQFIDDQPICLMFTGTVGTGKTTMLTDIALSIEVMFRDVAYEKILEIDSKYPNFPWILFEDELKAAIEAKEVYNLTTCRDWIGKKYAVFYKDPVKENIFGYDVERYRSSFDDALTDRSIWYELENYACLYFIYIIQSSLLVANYSIRVDNVFVDNGHFPRWQCDFFRSSPAESEARSRYAHVLDYDALRLGKKVLKDNPRRGAFEFGIVPITEFGKERGNSLTNQELKKNDANTNQKNDLFEYALKMSRHKATIDNFPFVRFIADEQRPESVGADIRHLLNIVHIRDKAGVRLVMPLFFVTELLHDLIYPVWKRFYEDFRFVRGDMCFSVYLAHNLMSKFHNFYLRMYNTFGVSKLKVEVERGTQDGVLMPRKYFLSSKKIYSNRFSTDCYRSFFEPQLRQTKFGVDTFLEYADTVANEDELFYQNSFFIEDLQKLKD